MCVIAYKPQNTAMPSMAALRNCYDSNPDGAGIAYKSGSTLAYAKGFLTFEQFEEAITMLNKSLDLRAAEVVMHFRIATSGGVSPAMCHPFPVADNFNQMEKLSGSPSALLFHNGVIGMGTKAHSDTELFVLDKVYPAMHDVQLLRTVLNVPAQRFVYLSRSQPTIVSGDFVQSEGTYYSNYSFEDWHWKGTSTSRSKSSFYYDDMPDERTELFDALAYAYDTACSIGDINPNLFYLIEAAYDMAAKEL